MKYFNIAGPCIPQRHYMLSAAERLPAARELVTRGDYFVVHAPRQTGKTTVLDDLSRRLTATGEYAALKVSCESASAFGDDVELVEDAVLQRIRREARLRLPTELWPPDPWPTETIGTRVVGALTDWAQACPLPLVLLLDEIDALSGPGLITVLRQLRDGYTSSRADFPHSVALCGMRDVRDYKGASGGDTTRTFSPSPFNIKVDSLRLEDFSKSEVAELYAQHTADTGQEFAPQAVDLAHYYSGGQPWLVNALADTVIRRMKIDSTITDDHIDEAKEQLIRARATHLDSLAAKLSEPMVRRVIEPLIAGELSDADFAFDDAVSYVTDLGLVARGNPVRVANPIYKEVILRVLGNSIERNVTVDPDAFRLPDGRIDFELVLREFTDFWVQHGMYSPVSTNTARWHPSWYSWRSSIEW